jgi:hypothetical protein
VVTLLTEPPLEVSLELEDDVEPEEDCDDCDVVAPDVVVVVDGVEATVVPVDVAAEAFLARAGSCPEASTSVISSQAATNSATDPATIRRRIERARATRALLSACPRARASARLMSDM